MTAFIVSADLKAHLETMASSISQKKGSTVFKRGDKAVGVYVIEDGKVELILDAGRRNYPARTVGAGAVIGVPGVLSGGAEYTLTARTVEDCKFSFVQREKLLAFLRANPTYCLQFVEMLSKEITEMRTTVQRKRDEFVASA